MNVKRVLSAVTLTTLLVFAGNAFGAGFALYEGGAKGNGIGSGMAAADDVSAIFFNPAIITELEGKNFMAGVSLIAPWAELTIQDSVYDPQNAFQAEYDDQIFTPPHAYYSQPINDKLFFGVGTYVRFGLGTKYEEGEDFIGRYSNIDTQIATVTLGGNLAYRVNDRLSLAFGLSATYFHAELNNAIDANLFLGNPNNDTRTQEFDAIQKLEDETFGFGFNFAAHIRPTDRFSIGIQYVSEVEIELDEGRVNYQRPSAQVPSTWFVDTNAALDPFDLPEFIMIGLGYQSSDRLTWEFGAIRTGWASLEELVFNYETPFVVVPGLNLAVDRVVRELKWEDTWRYNLGASFMVNDTWDFLGGIIFDESPVPDETISYLLPANDRTLVNVGARIRAGVWTFDGALNYLVINDRNIIYDDPAFQAERQLAEGVLRTQITDGGAWLLNFSASRKF